MALPRARFRPSERALVTVRGAPAADDEQTARPRRATCRTQEHAPNRAAQLLDHPAGLKNDDLVPRMRAGRRRAKPRSPVETLVAALLDCDERPGRQKLSRTVAM